MLHIVTEVGGWKKTGRPKQSFQSYIEVKTLRCNIYGPELVKCFVIFLLLHAFIIRIQVRAKVELYCSPSILLV